MTMYLGQHDLGTWRLISDVRRGTMPTLLHDWANTVHYSADTSTYQVVNELDQIWTFSRNSETWAWVEDSNGDPVLKKFAVDEPVKDTIDPATGQSLGYRALAGFTNSLLWNRDLSNGVWSGSATVSQDAVGLDGVANTAWTVTDDNTGGRDNINQTGATADDSNPITLPIWVGKDDDETRFPLFRLNIEGGTQVREWVQLNTKTGETHEILDDGEFEVKDQGDFWLLILKATNNASGNSNWRFQAEPAFGDTLDGVANDSATGSIVYDFGGVYLNSSIAGPPIETEGSPVSTAADDATEPLPASCQDGFVWVVHARTPPAGAAAEFPRFGVIWSGLTSNRILPFLSADDNLRVQIRKDGTTLETFDVTVSPNTDHKIAIRIESGRHAVCVDGNEPVVGPSVGVPSDLNEKQIGHQNTDGCWNSTIALDELHSDPGNWSDADLQNASAL